MATDNNPRVSPSTEMRRGAGRRARKALAVIAFSYLGVYAITALCVPPILYLTNGPQTTALLVRTIAESFLRLPMPCVVLFVAFNALLTAEIVVELLRFGSHRTRSWSDAKHVAVVLLAWIVFLSGQLPFALVAQQRLLGK